MNIIPIIIVLIVLLILAIGYILFYIAAVRRNKKPFLTQNKWLEPFKKEIVSGVTWFKSQNPECVHIRSKDGLLLTGYFSGTDNAIGTILLVHGYRSDPYSDFGVSFPYYHSLGLNILAVYQRAHGESEGKYISFGIKERFDVHDWAYYLFDRFGEEHRIIIGGISMGSSTVLMSLGTNLPTNVKFVIGDCGYTSPYDEFLYLINKRYHLPSKPVLALLNYYSKMFAGFRFQDYSTTAALSHNSIPLILIHGERDTLVPIQFTDQNNNACNCDRIVLKSKDAGHGGSFFYSRSEYQSAISKYIELYF